MGCSTIAHIQKKVSYCAHFIAKEITTLKEMLFCLIGYRAQSILHTKRDVVARKKKERKKRREKHESTTHAEIAGELA
jgi:uncharacterized metal-binding protein